MSEITQRKTLTTLHNLNAENENFRGVLEGASDNAGGVLITIAKYCEIKEIGTMRTVCDAWGNLMSFVLFERKFKIFQCTIMRNFSPKKINSIAKERNYMKKIEKTIEMIEKYLTYNPMSLNIDKSKKNKDAVFPGAVVQSNTKHPSFRKLIKAIKLENEYKELHPGIRKKIEKEVMCSIRIAKIKNITLNSFGYGTSAAIGVFYYSLIKQFHFAVKLLLLLLPIIILQTIYCIQIMIKIAKSNSGQRNRYILSFIFSFLYFFASSIGLTIGFSYFLPENDFDFKIRMFCVLIPVVICNFFVAFLEMLFYKTFIPANQNLIKYNEWKKRRCEGYNNYIEMLQQKYPDPQTN